MKNVFYPTIIENIEHYKKDIFLFDLIYKNKLLYIMSNKKDIMIVNNYLGKVGYNYDSDNYIVSYLKKCR